jgi:bifunctional enzyme CysN/CysC
MGQKPATLWFTGLSGAGKSMLANEVEKALGMQGKYTMLLDGDNVRMGLNQNLGFEEKDRIENIRRVAEVAKLMNDAGLIVLTSFISPYESDRARAREIIGSTNFIEIYVSTPLAKCERRDVKGLYKKARNGQIPNFTGISSPYEPPVHAEVEIDTSQCTLEEAAEYVLNEIRKYL